MQLAPVSSEAVAQYRPLIDKLARRFTRAEFDDLVQVGMIHVWRQLQRSKHPSVDGIGNAMRNECRRVARRGMGGYKPFEHDITFVSLDQLRDAELSRNEDYDL